MTHSRRPIARVFALSAIVTVLSTGCATEYHGFESDIDGILWRQIDAIKQPGLDSIYEPQRDAIGNPAMTADTSDPAVIDTPDEYLASLDLPLWDGTTQSLPRLNLEDGGIIMYNTASTDDAATVSIFMASGPRPHAPAEDGGTYSGPSEIYSCWSFTANFWDNRPVVDRTALDECPPELVGVLPEDAAFVSAEVFDG